jgi:hypothetical protein
MSIGFKLKKCYNAGFGLVEMFPCCDHCGAPIHDNSSTNIEYEDRPSGKAYIIHKACSNEFRSKNPNILRWATLKKFQITSKAIDFNPLDL